MSASVEREFIDLNDDCLLEIFKYLSFKDVIALSETSNRFDDVICDVLRLGSAEFSAADFVSCQSMVTFLQKFGSHITKLRLHIQPSFSSNKLLQGDFRKFVVDRIDDNIINSVRIGLDYNTSHERLAHFARKFRNMKSLAISPLLENTRHSTNAIRLFASAVKLQSLELVECHLDSRELKFIEGLTELKSITFDSCKIVDDGKEAFERAIRSIGTRLLSFSVIQSPFPEPFNYYCRWPIFFSDLVAGAAPNLTTLNLTMRAGCGTVEPHGYFPAEFLFI